MKAKTFAFLIILTMPFSMISKGMTIPENVKKLVAFVYVGDNPHDARLSGTGFFVSVSKVSSTNGPTAYYFVTAKHVILKPDRSPVSRIFLRVNDRHDGVAMVPVDLILAGTNKNVYFHQDADVDLAVIAGVPDPQYCDIMTLDSGYLTSESDIRALHIHEGTDTFFTGLFTHYFGSSRNYPIVRFGKFALATDEKLDWPEPKFDSGTNIWQITRQNLYLIESTSLGGNSGSPVFFQFGMEREANTISFGGPELKLAGVMKGNFGDIESIIPIETAVIPGVRTNTGVAAVIPAYLLHDILFCDEIKTRRDF